MDVDPDSRAGAPDERGSKRPDRPLAGVRVLDIATFLAAPFAGTVLADFGAEVIKIEQPRSAIRCGDSARRPMPGTRWSG